MSLTQQQQAIQAIMNQYGFSPEMAMQFIQESGIDISTFEIPQAPPPTPQPQPAPQPTGPTEQEIIAQQEIIANQQLNAVNTYLETPLPKTQTTTKEPTVATYYERETPNTVEALLGVSKNTVISQNPAINVLFQNQVFYDALLLKEITPQQYNEAMTFQSKALKDAQASLEKNPLVTATEIQTLQTQYPEFWNQIKDKTITNIVITDKGVSAEVFDKAAYQQLTAPVPMSVPIPEVAPPVTIVAPTWENLLTNPVGVASTLLGITQKATGLLPESPLKTVMEAEVGGFGELINQQVEAKNAINTIIGKATEPLPFTPNTPIEQIGQAVILGTEVTAVAIVAPEILPAAIPVTTPTLLAAAGLNVGIGEVASEITAGKLLSIPEAAQAAFTGEAFAMIGAGVMKGISEVPKLSPLITTVAGRAAVNAGISGVAGYALSGGNVEASLEGAAFGAAFSLGGEAVGKGFSELKVKLGFETRLKEGLPTIGKAGEEVKTWLSEPIEDLGGKRVRVVSGVTEKPADYMTLAKEYIGETIPTAHATLEKSAFNLSKGGETLLMGFPEEASGLRPLGLYSAPGSKEFLNIYGGYMGIGEIESGVMPKIRIGGKSTVISTLGTEIQPKYIPEVSGLTAIPTENLLGFSTERQVVTTTAYEKYIGSIFKSEGKVGTFQIKQSPEGLLGKIPIIKDLASTFTSFTVYKGSFGPVKGAVVTPITLDVAKYTDTWSKSVKNISMPSLPISIVTPTIPISTPKTQMSTITSTPKISIPNISAISTKAQPSTFSTPKFSLPNFSTPTISTPKVPTSTGKEASTNSFMSNLSKSIKSLGSSIAKDTGFSLPSTMSIPSVTSTPSKISIPSTPSISSTVSKGSMPSIPSIFSTPEIPSFPSISSKTSKTSIPSIPSIISTPSKTSPPSIPSITSTTTTTISPPKIPSDFMKPFKIGTFKLNKKYGVKEWGIPVLKPSKAFSKFMGLEETKRKRGKR